LVPELTDELREILPKSQEQVFRKSLIIDDYMDLVQLPAPEEIRRTLLDWANSWRIGPGQERPAPVIKRSGAKAHRQAGQAESTV
jgi:hypothetical protein